MWRRLWSMGWQSEVLIGCELLWSAGCIRVCGDIDLANASAVERRIRALIGLEDLIVDCREVTFVDAAGIRMLARVGAAAVAAGANVRLRCSPVVIETLKLCYVRELPGLTLDRGSHDSRRSLR